MEEIKGGQDRYTQRRNARYGMEDTSAKLNKEQDVKAEGVALSFWFENITRNDKLIDSDEVCNMSFVRDFIGPLLLSVWTDISSRSGGSIRGRRGASRRSLHSRSTFPFHQLSRLSVQSNPASQLFPRRPEIEIT